MSKGLDALEKIKQAEYFVDFELDAKIKDDYKTELAIIEQELKQAQEDKEMLDIFKNALTIERKPINNIHAFKKDREGCISGLASEIIEIKQNELDNKLRSNLREWVLKNAFPKELKALEIVKNKLVNVQALIHSCNLDEYNVLYIKALQLTQEEYELLKEVLL